MAEKAASPDFQALISGHIDYYPDGTNYVCFLCSFETADCFELLNHLYKTHNFVFTDFLHIPLVPKYLEYWRSHPPPIIEFGNIKDDSVFQNTIDSDALTTIDINTEEDKEIRNSLHKMRLDQLMVEHEHERTEMHHIDCLFCPNSFDGTWQGYLQWLFEEHQFNPGRPSNLIFIPKMIEVLRSKLESNVCIYCSSVFPNQRILRSHMRKKKHMKIPNDSYFDRFYMINYLELNGFTGSDDDDDNNFEHMESLELAAADDKETEVNETSCLICDYIFPSPEEVIQHMRNIHDFDIKLVRQKANYDFYNCVRFINFARYMKSNGRCFICKEFVEGDYPEHIQQHKVKFPEDTTGIFGEDQLLIPFIEGDPLLTELEDDI